MSTARKYNASQRAMSHESRNKAIAALQILWKQMRPDLFDKDELRAERLAWITSFLQLPRPLESITDLSDTQLGVVLEEMRRMTGTSPKPKPVPTVAPSSGNVVSIEQFKRQHFASDEQKYTLDKIIKHLGWSDEAASAFLVKRGFGETVEKIAFKKANSLTMILLNIAADKDLRRVLPKDTKITRKMTMQHIPLLKRKLEIDG